MAKSVFAGSRLFAGVSTSSFKHTVISADTLEPCDCITTGRGCDEPTYSERSDSALEFILEELDHDLQLNQAKLWRETDEIRREAFWHLEDIAWGLVHKLNALEDRTDTLRFKNRVELRALVDAFA